MKKLLITGGTVFVSRFIAEFFKNINYEVYVLNRNTKIQVDGVKLIECDRNNIGCKLENHHFDFIIDVNAYNKSDIKNLLAALNGFSKYIFISSSAVYGEKNTLINENDECKYNPIWKKYGIDKREAELYLLSKVPDAYILRPPYLYGPMENLYRAAFVFECAEKKRPFYLPNDGNMKLHFFHVEDLCKVIRNIIEKQIDDHIFNVGNEDAISIKNWVEMCYNAVGVQNVEFINLYNESNQRDYFCFYDYEYQLDVTLQNKYFLEEKIMMIDGLRESYNWYKNNKDKIEKKNYINYLVEKYEQL